MPLIDQNVLKGVVFLYPNAASALAHTKNGGSGFFVGRPVRGLGDDPARQRWVPYLVSNLHVVSNARCPVARFNKRDGSPNILDLHSSDWTPHPEGADIAAVCLAGIRNWQREDINFVGTEEFVTRKSLMNGRLESAMKFI